MEKIIDLLEGRVREGAFREGSYYPFVLKDGTEGLFEIMLFESGEWALSAYAGEAAIQALLSDTVGDSATEVERLEAAHAMDAFVLSVGAEGREFARFEPRRPSRDMNEEELQSFSEILTAAAEMPSPVKLPKKKKRSFPAGACPNELLAHKMKTAPRGAEKWIAHIFLHVGAIESEEGGEAFFPYMLMLMEEKSGVMLTAGISSTFEDYSEGFLTMLADAIEAHGRPKAILAINERTRDFFKPLCALLGIEFEKRSSSPTLKKALEDYLRIFGEQGEEPEALIEEKAEEPPANDALDDAEGWNALNESLLALVADPKALPKLSDELLAGLLADMESGELRNELEGTIRTELRRRGI